MSNPTWPVYTFRVNLETLNRYSWSQPYYNTQIVGNETEPEGDNFKYTRSAWLASLLPGYEFIADKEGVTFTAYGEKATYLKKTYVSVPPSPNDTLILVS